jgi:hypothetical protein
VRCLRIQATCAAAFVLLLVSSGAAERKTSASLSAHWQPQTEPLNLVINDLSTSASKWERVPRAYRTMSPDEIAIELKHLRESARKLPSGSTDRSAVEDLIRSLEVYDKTGVDPNALLDEITSQVAQLRGLPPLEPVRFRILDRAALRYLLESKLEEGLPPNWLQEYEAVAKIVGAIPERTNLRKTMLSLLSEQIAGLYDDQTKRLCVLADFNMSRPLAKIILAHEICHALQDQHYNLKHLPLMNYEDNDAALAALSVVEGDATLLMQDYAGESIQGSDVLKLLDIFEVDQRALNSAPYFLKQQLIFPYMGGADFLTRISYRDPELREEAFINPPQSTEQIMHPEKYASGDIDPPTSVSLAAPTAMLGVGWKRTIRSNWGEFQIKTLFEVWRQWNQAERVAEGWAGDRYALYRSGTEYAYFWKSEWDTTKDAREFYDGISELMRSKRYREPFAKVDFGGNTEEEKILDSTADEKQETEAPELHLRFRIQEKAVLVEITNSAHAGDRLREMDSLFFSRDPTPANE